MVDWTVVQRQADADHRPYSLLRPRAGPSSQSRLPPAPTEGARDARGPIGPTGLDASRHRGLSKSLCLTARSGSNDRQGKPQVRQTLGVPRAVFIGLLRALPGGRTATQGRNLRVTFHRWGPQAVGDAPVTGAISAARPSQASGRAVGTPDAARLGPPGPHSASPLQGHVPATASRPASGDADQTPLGNGAGFVLLIFL